MKLTAETLKAMAKVNPATFVGAHLDRRVAECIPGQTIVDLTLPFKDHLVFRKNVPSSGETVLQETEVETRQVLKKEPARLPMLPAFHEDVPHAQD